MILKTLFNVDGNVIPGIHEMSESDFHNEFGFNSQRQFLLSGFKRLLKNLKQAGCKKIFVDGSFTSKKQIPNDYDLCWETMGVKPELLDPLLLNFSPIGRAIMKSKYLGDIFPAHITEKSSGKFFLDFFQIDKLTGNNKGIIVINL